MESWMVSLAIAVAGGIATFAITKNRVDNNDKQILTILSDVKEIKNKLSSHSELLSEHNIKIQTGASMKEVRAEFVSKEMFKQLEKHMDEKFSRVERGISEILRELRDK